MSTLNLITLLVNFVGTISCLYFIIAEHVKILWISIGLFTLSTIIILINYIY